MQVVMILRLELALGLLARSNLNVGQIAGRVGFGSAFHFSRRFKRAFGSSPTQMRARLAAGAPQPVSALLRKSRL
jgi:transcriptional regulator GlxA family with amidase domain